MFASCVVVHLDKDKVVSPIFSRGDVFPMDFALPRLPSREVTALLGSLERIVPSPIGHTSHPRNGAQPTPEASPHESNTVNEVELMFGEGPVRLLLPCFLDRCHQSQHAIVVVSLKLGITFESTHLRLLAASNFDPERQLGGSAVVKALPKLRNGLAGPAERSGLISAGSYLVGINGQSTLDLTFEETIDYLRRASRPIRLRFLNATLPYENACHFAERLQALSLVSALQTVHENQLLPWVDTLRGAFAGMFASIFCDYQRYVDVHCRDSDSIGPSSRRHDLPTPEQYGRLRRRSSALAFLVQFDYESFCSAVPHNQRFMGEFTQTQCFADFINERVMGSTASRVRGASTPMELFQECIYLTHESSNARAAIMLLFERDGSPVESSVLDLPAQAGDGANCASKSPPTEVRSSFDRTSASSAGEVAPDESPDSSPPASPTEGKVNPIESSGDKQSC
jgi:hypothetical protein